jgi:peptide/nickel transport system ATP-binding protein
MSRSTNESTITEKFEGKTLDEPVAADPLLSVRDLYVSFSTLDGISHVIDGVNLSIDRGEVLTIAGETGCGKSVTMKAILGLLPQPPASVSGEIVFDGTSLLECTEREFAEIKGRRMSIVFQDPMSSLNPVFTIGEQLTDTAQFGGGDGAGVFGYLRRKHTSNQREKARERAIEMLRDVQMPDPEAVMDSYPSQLSGGMCQRALIAQALLNDPDLLIADEIGTALDVTIHDQIMALLMDLIEERDLSLLMITHNLGVARQISDRIAVMYGGTIVETAPADELFEEPKHPYTQGLITSIPRLSGGEMAKGIDGSVPEYLDPPSGCRFHPRCPYAHDACREERPNMYRTGAQSGVECVLYDSDVPEEDRPTIEKTKRRMSGKPTVVGGAAESNVDEYRAAESEEGQR